MAANLFQLGDFTLHSGKKSNFKIECDNLTCEDYRALADLVAAEFKFATVFGVPTGGLNFAEYLKAHIDPNATRGLIVDDVLTTGASMEEFRKSLPIEHFFSYGVVIFARGKCPDWIHPLFQMW